MNILLIEDSDYKIKNITSLLDELSFKKDIHIAKSFQSGLIEIMQFKPDLIILDMTLPTSDSIEGEAESRIRPFGGEELIREIESEGVEAKVIIVTQFDHFPTTTGSINHNSIFDKMKTEFPTIFHGGVYYSFLDSKWEKNLKELILSIR